MSLGVWLPNRIDAVFFAEAERKDQDRIGGEKEKQDLIAKVAVLIARIPLFVPSHMYTIKSKSYFKLLLWFLVRAWREFDDEKRAFGMSIIVLQQSAFVD